MGEEKEASFYTGFNYLFAPLYETAFKYLRDVPFNETIVELGCGCGYLAELIGNRAYIGIDFSRAVLEKARKRAKGSMFIFADLRDSKSFGIYQNFHAFVLLEILEHITADWKIIASIPSGSKVVFSVPDFNSKAHVRWFKNQEKVKERYGEWLAFGDMTILTKPENKNLFVFEARRL